MAFLTHNSWIQTYYYMLSLVWQKNPIFKMRRGNGTAFCSSMPPMSTVGV